MNWIEELRQELADADAQGLRRSLRARSGPSGPVGTLDGRRLVLFAGNDYLDLGRHPRVLEAARAALETYGAGAGASRLVGGGGLDLHKELEDALARFKGLPAALVYSSGSLANLGLLPVLAGPGDALLLDKACHATLYDGARLSGADWSRFPHQNLDRLEALLAGIRPRHRRVAVVVEGVYSMDGDVAPLPGLLEITARHGALLVVDEAHATGVLGPTGRGVLEHHGLAAPSHLILTGTLSKALASLGGYVAGPPELIQALVHRSRSFIYATALPAPCAAAALEALRVIQGEPDHLRRLRENRGTLVRGLARAGWDLHACAAAILPLTVGTARAALDLEGRLAQAGLYVPAMRPPTVPAGACRLRVSVSAGHRAEHLEALLQALGPRP